MQATIVEFNRRAVGVAVRTQAGFRFFAAGRDFAHLEGHVFRRIASLFRALNEAGAEPDSS